MRKIIILAALVLGFESGAVEMSAYQALVMTLGFTAQGYGNPAIGKQFADGQVATDAVKGCMVLINVAAAAQQLVDISIQTNDLVSDKQIVSNFKATESSTHFSLSGQILQAHSGDAILALQNLELNGQSYVIYEIESGSKKVACALLPH